MMNPNKGNSSLNTLVGIIDNALSSVSTAMPVTVIQVYDNHTVDVMPMVDMLDNAGNAVEHAPISGIPYARLQGGDYGLIIEPKVGDKGLVVFASRDISDVVQSKGKAKPASLRKHSMSDGMYIASLLYEDPKTYLQIEKEKITIHTKDLLVENDENIVVKTENFTLNNKKTNITTIGSIVVSGTDISLTAPIVNITGAVSITGDATIGGISFLEHVHQVIKEGKPTKKPS